MVLIIGIIISFGVSVFGFRPWFPRFRYSVSAKNFHFSASVVLLNTFAECDDMNISEGVVL